MAIHIAMAISVDMMSTTKLREALDPNPYLCIFITIQNTYIHTKFNNIHSGTYVYVFVCTYVTKYLIWFSM